MLRVSKPTAYRWVSQTVRCPLSTSAARYRCRARALFQTLEAGKLGVPAVKLRGEEGRRRCRRSSATKCPAVEAERRWPATTIGGLRQAPERVQVSAPTRWGHDPIESTLPPYIVQRPIGTEFDVELRVNPTQSDAARMGSAAGLASAPLAGAAPAARQAPRYELGAAGVGDGTRHVRADGRLLHAARGSVRGTPAVRRPQARPPCRRRRAAVHSRGLVVRLAAARPGLELVRDVELDHLGPRPLSSSRRRAVRGRSRARGRGRCSKARCSRRRSWSMRSPSCSEAGRGSRAQASSRSSTSSLRLR